MIHLKNVPIPSSFITYFLSFFLVNIISIPGLSGQTYLGEILEKWNNSAQYLEEIAHIMPDSLYDFKPTDQQMSFKDQLLHIANNMINLSKNQLSYNTDSTPHRLTAEADPLEVRNYLKSSFQFAANAIAAETESSLNIQTKFFAGPKTHRQIINLINDHVTHHRGQLLIYLRLCGYEPPRYIGW